MSLIRILLIFAKSEKNVRVGDYRSTTAFSITATLEAETREVPCLRVLYPYFAVTPFLKDGVVFFQF